MKLGLTYMVFDGYELLEFAAKSIRNQIDHISVTYQNISYFGNPADAELLPLLEKLKSEGLIDELVFFETDLSLEPKENELRLRNIGLNISKKAGCTHHISADVDEFYDAKQLEHAKKVFEDGDYDFSVAYMETYYKEPTYLVIPSQNLVVSFIHPVTNEYTRTVEYPFFPFHMETTRRFAKCDKYKLFNKEEFIIHHMSYVRKDMRKKFKNNDNNRYYKEKFFTAFENHKVGGRVCLVPDFLNRRTRPVENKFNIHFK